jgi:hypothetical protein
MKHRLRCPVVVLALLAMALGTGATWCVGSSSAAITLGSSLATPPGGSNSDSNCSTFNSDRGCLAVDDVIPGRTVAVPPGMTGFIDRWNVLLGAGTDAQKIRIRIVHPASPNTFTVISSGALHDVAAGAGMYSFTDHLQASAGDQVGLESEGAKSIVWRAPSIGGTQVECGPGAPPDGGTTGPCGSPYSNQEHTFNADFDPSNTLALGALTRNKKKGTATLSVNAPNPGELTGSGNGVKASSAGRAVISKSVPAGAAQLLIKAKGKKKRKLNETGKVKLNVAITFTPTGGDPSEQSLKVRLKKKL